MDASREFDGEEVETIIISAYLFNDWIIFSLFSSLVMAVRPFMDSQSSFFSLHFN
jgi:hypothetical protein